MRLSPGDYIAIKESSIYAYGGSAFGRIIAARETIDSRKERWLELNVSWMINLGRLNDVLSVLEDAEASAFEKVPIEQAVLMLLGS